MARCGGVPIRSAEELVLARRAAQLAQLKAFQEAAVAGLPWADW